VALGTLPGPGKPLRRLRVGAALLAASVALAAFAGTPALLGGLLVLSGLAIAPTIIAATQLAESASPSSRVTEGITWMTTGLTAGVAPGAALSGAAVDAWGASLAFIVPVAGGVLAAAAGWMIADRPARQVGPEPLAGETVDTSSARLGAGPGRRPDA
jgi:predicted MFS family arabinose efflux permease